MLEVVLHHVSVPTADLERSARFYESVLGLKRIPRPPFPVAGIWFALGRNHLHVTVHPEGSFRKCEVDANDVHFALRTEDFEATYAWLKDKGYDETLPAGDPKQMILKRTGAAGFPQLFLMDPDNNTIEINTAPFYEER